MQADILELFAHRRQERGVLHAQWRLYHDVASLWYGRRQTEHRARARGGPRVASDVLLRDVGGDLRYAIRVFGRQPGILLLTAGGLSLGL
ncbi:MAG TPA: hypothetical protein VGD94_12400, partial [Vicinamibacterales bacterium]